MSTPAAKILVAACGQSAWIQISGRANFTASVDFKTLVAELHRTGHQTFELDLTECVLMDSTFLGVLAGFGMRFGAQRGGAATGTVELVNPNARVGELLANLGVAHLFKITNHTVVAPAEAVVEMLSPTQPKAEELARTCLEAHQTLMDIEPKNIPKFKDVAQFFAEDLKKFKG